MSKYGSNENVELLNFDVRLRTLGPSVNLIRSPTFYDPFTSFALRSSALWTREQQSYFTNASRALRRQSDWIANSCCPSTCACIVPMSNAGIAEKGEIHISTYHTR